MATPDVGHGTVISFGTSMFSANVTEIGDISVEYAVVDTSHLGTTDARTYMLGRLANNAEIVLTIQWDHDDVPPAGAVAETITITWYDGEVASFTGVCPGYTRSGTTSDGLNMGTVRVQPSGEITWS